MPEYDLGFSAQPKFGPFGFCLQLIFAILPTQMQTILIASKTKEAQDASKNESIGVGNLVFYQLIQELTFVSVRGGVSQNQPTLGAEINPFIFFGFGQLNMPTTLNQQGKKLVTSRMRS